MNHRKACEIVRDRFLERGWMVMPIQSQNANGADVTVVNKQKAFKIEVKTLSRKKSGSWQAKPVEPKRRSDDFVAVVHRDEMILIEPMKDYLKVCSKSGMRSLTILVMLSAVESFGIMK